MVIIKIFSLLELAPYYKGKKE